MKVSLIATVLNEEKSIKAFLDSIESQTKAPAEVIIVDAGSTDKTVKIIKNHQTSSMIRIIRSKDCNRSQGRNLAIKKAKHSVIGVSDAGCILDKDWLKRITQPFTESKVDAVAGFYQAQSSSIFQKCITPFVAITPSKLDPKTYLPSSRSMAFRKKSWNKIGRYPENINFCEDLVFASRLKKQTNLVVKPNAIVYWQMVTNLKDYFHQIKNYATGDTQAKYHPHLVKIASTYLRYLLFIAIPPLFFFYLFWPIFKHYSYIKHPRAFIYLPIIQLATDLGIIIGSLKGAKISL